MFQQVQWDYHQEAILVELSVCIQFCMCPLLLHTEVDVGFAEPSYTVRENSGSVSVCVNISGAVLERDITVLLSTRDDDATCESTYINVNLSKKTMSWSTHMSA